jgi:hypothetical protein
VHIALHGCKQNYDMIQDRYIKHAGYNEWADTNRLIILYPQTIVGDPAQLEPTNPFGCWDWWGYTNFNYAVRAGRQIATIKAMLDRLTSRYRPQPAAPAAASFGVIVNDVSDAGVSLAWSPMAGAATYSVAREAAGATAFTPIGTAAGPSYGDMGLQPAASYRYQVTAGSNGTAPVSQTVTATTRPASRDVPGWARPPRPPRVVVERDRLQLETQAGQPFERGGRPEVEGQVVRPPHETPGLGDPPDDIGPQRKRRQIVDRLGLPPPSRNMARDVLSSRQTPRLNPPT